MSLTLTPPLSAPSGTAARLRNRPQDLVSTAWAQLRHARGVTATPQTRIRRGSGAALEVDGRLSLGYFPNRIGEIAQSGWDRTLVQLGDGARLRTTGLVTLGPGTRLILGPGATASFGADSFVSGNTQIVVTSELSVGSGVAISWGVQLLDDDLHDLDGSPRSAPIRVEDGVWIGTGALVLKGVTLGAGSVVAAGSVVTRDVEPGCLVGGAPAKVLKSKVRWAR